MAFCKGRGTAGRGIGIGPYESACRGGRPCPPGPDNATPCRAGPVCPAVGAGKIRVRPSRTPAPTERFVGEGLCPSRGRPQGSPLRKRYKKCGEAGRCRHRPLRRFDKKVPAWNPPVTASPCQPPLGKGAKGTRGRGMRIATASVRTGFAMTHYK